MKPCVKVLSALSTASLLACSQLSLAPTLGAPVAGPAAGTPALPGAQPLANGARPVSAVEGLFALGRSAHNAGDLVLAEQWYTQVLAMQPSHLGALNSMAVIYAQTQRSDQALEFFKRALELDPQAAYVHNNLGYALLLAGRLAEAGSELARAYELNPSSAQSRQNLELLARATEAAAPGPQLVAVAKNVYELRDAPAARPVPMQAAAPMPVAVPMQVAVPTPVAVSTPVAVPMQVAVSMPVAAPMQVAVSMPVAAPMQVAVPTPVVAPLPVAAPMRVAVSTPVAMPMQAAVSIPVAAPMQVAATVKELAPGTSLQGVRIEVSNGVGIRYLARRTAERLAQTGWVTARLTNQPRFRQATTEIQFVAGQKEAAQALSAQLPVSVRTVACGGLVRNLQMRLVLGHDLVGKTLVAWLDSGSQTPVALAGADGWRFSANPALGWLFESAG
ncbi:MAG: tetratricopeptide repeat protein [Rhodoferax sp.]|uniref:tetratricopeptide repeat protein n=1 Tax=Rhodoferax sp. TaxID=50421 RepID=UPI00261BF52C|nr:tetratricopeptide repeat protein [Rhodoferax sp.]MDD5333816.1 tetratricopeptide repeat protein [Rhodoferax sp.]